MSDTLFMLVEILVGSGIIATLVAILLPDLSRVRLAAMGLPGISSCRATGYRQGGGVVILFVDGHAAKLDRKEVDVVCLSDANQRDTLWNFLK